MVKGKRPVADSKAWDGPLFRIEFPNQTQPGEWYLFHLSTDIEQHERTKLRLTENGFTDFRAYQEGGENDPNRGN